MASLSQHSAYSDWSNEQLIERVTSLESQLKEQTQRYRAETLPSASHSPKLIKSPRIFDPSKYSTRLIALKFAYLGQNYNGLEHHTKNDTPLPTIEEELWKALSKAKLISPTPNDKIAEGEVNWDGCEYSKCGRTDRGVSAFGQVVGIRIRSNRPQRKVQEESEMDDHSLQEELKRSHHNKAALHSSGEVEGAIANEPLASPFTGSEGDDVLFDHIGDELPYAQILNRILPSDIRILAWCPNPPTDFSARFSCKERRYRYFFTNPAFTPIPTSTMLRPTMWQIDGHSQSKEGWLDIEKMRSAATKFIGLHDFRNFCKVDPSKQLTNFERRIFHADISEVAPHEQSAGYMLTPAFCQQDPSFPQKPTFDPITYPVNTATPRLYTFTLHGSAFLWHQVRHMVSILFLIGQGLETPNIIDELLDVRKNPCKPHYEMADDAPLVLWDCIFPSNSTDRPTESQPDALNWIYVGDTPAGARGGGVSQGSKNSKYGVGGLVPELWKVWRQRKMDEVLAGSLLNLAVRQGNGGLRGKDREGVVDGRGETEGARKGKGSQKVYLGGDDYKLVGKYLPLMQRKRMETVEVINERYARKGDAECK